MSFDVPLLTALMVPFETVTELPEDKLQDSVLSVALSGDTLTMLFKKAVRSSPILQSTTSRPLVLVSDLTGTVGGTARTLNDLVTVFFHCDYEAPSYFFR